jgi:hypothetical protein
LLQAHCAQEEHNSVSQQQLACSPSLPASFEQALDDGHCIVGSPVRVRDEIGKQANEAGVTYIMKRCHHAFLRIHG